MTAIQFEDAVKPAKVTRVENPFTAIVTDLRDNPTNADGSERAKTFTIDAPKGCKKENEDPAVLKARRQLTDAGNALGVTVRTIYADAGKGKVQIMFWTVTKIKRAPKDAAAAASTPAKAAPAKAAAAPRKAGARRK